MYEIRFQIDALPEMRANKRWHWSKRYRHDQDWHWRVVAHVPPSARPPKPLERAQLTLIRFTTADERIDWDNLATSFKPVIDGLVHAKVLTDDQAWRLEATPLVKPVERAADGCIQVHVREL